MIDQLDYDQRRLSLQRVPNMESYKVASGTSFQ